MKTAGRASKEFYKEMNNSYRFYVTITGGYQHVATFGSRWLAEHFLPKIRELFPCQSIEVNGIPIDPYDPRLPPD